MTGITTFIATNIDDIFILMLFFTQVNDTFRRRHIIVGQYLGFTTIIIASLPGFFGGLIVPRAWVGLLGIVPIAIGITYLFRREKDEEIQAVSGEFKHSKSTTLRSRLMSFMSPQTYSVAAITFANGGDNIGIYVPLFANSDLAELGIILSVFFVFVGIWCYIAYQLTLQPNVAHILTRYGQAIVPFILIGLGVYILFESGSYHLITG